MAPSLPSTDATWHSTTPLMVKIVPFESDEGCPIKSLDFIQNPQSTKLGSLHNCVVCRPKSFQANHLLSPNSNIYLAKLHIANYKLRENCANVAYFWLAQGLILVDPVGHILMNIPQLKAVNIKHHRRHYACTFGGSRPSLIHSLASMWHRGVSQKILCSWENLGLGSCPFSNIPSTGKRILLIFFSQIK